MGRENERPAVRVGKAHPVRAKERALSCSSGGRRVEEGGLDVHPVGARRGEGQAAASGGSEPVAGPWRSLRTGRPLRTLCTLCTLRTLRTLCTSYTLRTLGPGLVPRDRGLGVVVGDALTSKSGLRRIDDAQHAGPVVHAAVV